MNLDLKNIQSQIACGQESALAELYMHLSKKLHHFSKALVRSPEIAAEVVEDVFVKLWSNREKINTIDNITVYLYVAVKNTSLNRLSLKARELVISPFDLLDIEINNEIMNPIDSMITSEMLTRMKKAVDALPPRCKIIFKLIREDGLKYKEVAQILNISVNTIDAQMAIAVKRICHALEINYSQKGFSGHFTQNKN